MPELWVPGASGPSLEDFVGRIHKRIEAYALRRGLKEAAVQIELQDGSLLWIQSISPEPGYGFITLCPHPEDEVEAQPSEELIVQVGLIKRISLRAAEAHRARFGFSVPEKG